MVIVALFGFMSLAHGPVMAFAPQQAPQAGLQSAQPVQQILHQIQPSAHNGVEAADHAHNHHTAASVCYATGCFVAMAPILVAALDNIPAPLQQLRPATAQAIVPAALDPCDPPPRLQI
jgi:hypothetical protein